MSETSTITIAVAAKPEAAQDTSQRRVTAWRVLLITSLSSGIFLFLLGLLLSLLSMLNFVSVNTISGMAEAAMLITAFALLFLTAHCLDRIGRMRDEQPPTHR